MMYADTDFFLALLKERDWLKEKAKRALEEYKGQIATSVVTFIELALIAKKYDLDIVRLFTSIMSICGIEDERVLKAAIYVRDYGLGVFDAFHGAYCDGKIVSSDHAYERIGIERIKLEEM